MQTARYTFERSCAIESLESRCLLSAASSAVFVGGAPAVVLPGRAAIATIRVNDAPTSSPVQVQLYASPTRQVSSNSVVVAQSRPVGAGQKTVRLRFSSAGIAVGNYYIVAQVVSAEVRGVGALAVSAAPRTTRFAAATVDLSAQFVREPVGQVYVGASQDTRTYAVLQIANSGTVAAAGTIIASISASMSDSFDASAVVVGSIAIAHARIAPGASRYAVVPITFKAGTAFGGYLLFAKVDATLSIAETRISNNLVRSPATIVISQARPVSVRHHHHHGGGEVDLGVVGEIDAGPGDYVDDGSTDTGDTGNSDTGNSNSGGSSSDTGGNWNYVPPTTQPDAPTTQPDGSGDSGSSSDSSSDDSSGDSSDGLMFFALSSQVMRPAPVQLR